MNTTRIILALSLLLACGAAHAETRKHADLVFASVNGQDLLLDLYLPENVAAPKLVVWLHGGVWRFGTKEDIPILDIVDHGFAVASIGFRNSPDGTFPAQMHDIKAAIRYLRGVSAEYGYDAAAIAVWGISTGGHLAALTGVSNGNAELEGAIGDYTHLSSDVQAVLDYAGPTNLHTILHQSTEHGVNVRAPGMEGLLGKPVDDPSIKHLGDLASPALQVGDKAPPLLVMHGVQDNQVPINQAIELQQAYLRAGRHVEAEWIVEATHGSGEYFRTPYFEKAIDFLRRML